MPNAADEIITQYSTMEYLANYVLWIVLQKHSACQKLVS